MKKINYIIGTAIALIVLNSCSDWLDVTPRSQIKESVVYESEDGFKKSLLGVYILIANEGLYGKTTTMYLPELLAWHWTIPVSSDNKMNRWANYDYSNTNVEGMIAALWIKYYNAIAQLNSLLQHLDNSTIQFEYNNDALIKGEALGLRAFLHLDLLRYFGPVPLNSAPDAFAIPYVTEMTKNPEKLISIPYSAVLQNIESDLDAAEKLLETVDPILFNSNNALNGYPGSSTNLPNDNFQLSRQARFNYYACLGAKARFYQWIGDKEKASEYARKVIEATNNDRSPKFPLATEETYSAGDDQALIMRCEHLFGIYNSDLQSIINPLFTSSAGDLTQTEGNMNDCYEFLINPSDIRYKPTNQPLRYWESKTYQFSVQFNHFRKYGGNEQFPASNYRVPLLRLSEMYFILIENLPLAEAKEYFSVFRFARVMDESLETLSFTNEFERRNRLEKEYRKEFFGEGQMFFFYKRLNYENYSWPSFFTLPVGAYVLPKPNAQLSFE